MYWTEDIECIKKFTLGLTMKKFHIKSIRD